VLVLVRPVFLSLLFFSEVFRLLYLAYKPRYTWPLCSHAGVDVFTSILPENCAFIALGAHHLRSHNLSKTKFTRPSSSAAASFSSLLGTYAHRKRICLTLKYQPVGALDSK